MVSHIRPFVKYRKNATRLGGVSIGGEGEI